MMPQLLTVRFGHPDSRPHRIWVPILPVLLILSPILVLAVLAGTVACLVFHINPLRALGASWRMFSALSGTQVDIEQSDLALLVAIR